MVPSTMTTSLIPCCICGAVIAPNASNQCASCLAAVDIGSLVRRGPGGGDLVVHQCRQCRRFDRTGDGSKSYLALGEESPELMAVLLRLIPALERNNSQAKRLGVRGLQVLDSAFVWTEPNSMRMRLLLTLKADVSDVAIQQRVKVEFLVRWRQCPDCVKESRQRTWQAIVQLRQKRDDGSRKGLLILEMAIAKNSELRRDILSVQTKRNGFDFYFPSQDKARCFVQYLARAAPMRTKTTQSLVSQDFKNNTANVKTTIACDMVPLCRDDLIVVQKRAKGVGNLSGRLCVVLKMSSVVHLVDASPVRDADVGTQCRDLHPETYWKGGEEKTYRLILSSKRLVRFVVLDVELCCEDERDRYRTGGVNGDEDPHVYQGPRSGVSKYALADVEVAREADFGANDETFRCVTHLGHLLQGGDTVLGYDITSTVLSGEAEWSMEHAFNASFVVPDVVLVRKVKSAGGEPLPGDGGAAGGDEDGRHRQKGKAKSSASKKRDRRMKKEERKQQKLQEAAARMGLDTDKDVHLNLEDAEDDDEGVLPEAARQEKARFEENIKMDEDLADDLDFVEQELAMGMKNLETEENASKGRENQG